MNCPNKIEIKVKLGEMTKKGSQNIFGDELIEIYFYLWASKTLYTPLDHL